MRLRYTRKYADGREVNMGFHVEDEEEAIKSVQKMRKLNKPSFTKFYDFWLADDEYRLIKIL